MKKFVILLFILTVIMAVSGCQAFVNSEKNDAITGATTADDPKDKADVGSVEVEDTDFLNSRNMTIDSGNKAVDEISPLVGAYKSAQDVKAKFPDLRRINYVMGPFGYKVDVMFSKNALATFFIDSEKNVLLGVCNGFYTSFEEKACFGNLM